jgi:hypothetical protein
VEEIPNDDPMPVSLGNLCLPIVRHAFDEAIFINIRKVNVTMLSKAALPDRANLLVPLALLLLALLR